jgi:hypothetical protein
MLMLHRRKKQVTLNGCKVKASPKTRCGNLCGWNVDIESVRYFKRTLTADEAIVLAYSQWTKEK